MSDGSGLVLASVYGMHRPNGSRSGAARVRARPTDVGRSAPGLRLASVCGQRRGGMLCQSPQELLCAHHPLRRVRPQLIDRGPRRFRRPLIRQTQPGNITAGDTATRVVDSEGSRDSLERGTVHLWSFVLTRLVMAAGLHLFVKWRARC